MTQLFARHCLTPRRFKPIQMSEENLCTLSVEKNSMGRPAHVPMAPRVQPRRRSLGASTYHCRHRWHCLGAYRPKLGAPYPGATEFKVLRAGGRGIPMSRRAGFAPVGTVHLWKESTVHLRFVYAIHPRALFTRMEPSKQ